MKIWMSVDLEGISGIVTNRQTDDSGPEYEYARRLMTADANAAIEGALAGGATEILVNDSHSTMQNILPDLLRREALLVSGSNKPLSMVQGIDSSVAAALFVGYHARAGTLDAVQDHTYSGRTVFEVRINGRPVGETGINAGVCGYFGVPVVFVSGDSAVAREARETLGEVVTVSVKEGQSRYSAVCLHPEGAHEAIRDGVQKALAERWRFKPFTFASPVTVELDVPFAVMADAAALIPGVRHPTPRTVAFTHDDYLVCFKALRAMITLAASAQQR